MLALLDLGNKSLSHFKFKAILDYKNDIYLKSIEKINQTNLLPGVLEFIKEKHEKNYLLAVGSSSKNAHFILKKTKIDHFFSCIIDGNMVKKPKPDPEVFINASIGLRLTPSECLVFEDAESGVIAAKKEDFVIGVGNIEIQESCDYFIKHMGEFDLSSYENLFEIDEWKIVQNQYEPSKQLQAESIFSIGNGSFGQRANFEEHFSGPTLQGSYLGGIYYPDKTKVGWWKNGYPEYFAKVLNSCNWIGINLKINDQEIDIHQQKVISFNKTLDMKKGVLTRNVTLELSDKKTVIRI